MTTRGTGAVARHTTAVRGAATGVAHGDRPVAGVASGEGLVARGGRWDSSGGRWAGPGGRVCVRLDRPAVSALLRPRALLAGMVLGAATVLMFCLDMVVGDYPLSLRDVVAAVLGSGDGPSTFVIQELRLPRALVGLCAGAAFALSGAVFQTATRNPLASPDMIGISAGATTAVVAGIVLGFGSGLGPRLLGLAGGLATALLIYALAWRRGATGYRIILVGIGVSWMCLSATHYLVSRADIAEASRALGWMVGDLNGRSWDDVTPLVVATGTLTAVVLALGRWTNTLMLGDDVARALGVPVEWTRVVSLLAGVGLVAFATASAGPIAFVALVAPQCAQRVAGLAWPPPTASALTGALMVLASDVVARGLLADSELPVGIVTGVLGAPFLIWLLVRANTAGSGS